MHQISDFKQMAWISQPSLYLMNESQLVMETKPFSGTFPHGLNPPSEARIHVSRCFSFKICLQHSFMSPFDECGIVFYNDGRRILTAGIKAHDDMTNQMYCTVFHQKQGDSSMRDLGVRLDKMYFRLYCRENMVKLQYSFNGGIFRDMRKFWLENPGDMHVSLYACSPLNSSFDAVFSKMILEEEGD